MTFNLIGLGLNANSISAEALEALKTCDEIYLENYTVDFPYEIKELEQKLHEKIIPLNREQTENESILKNAKEKNVALLVYGDALSATTHIQLILACKKNKIPCQVFQNASILIAIAKTGLSPYKFGKTTSMPNWKEHHNKPTSFTDIIKENQSIDAHTLILTDIGLTSKESLNQLEETIRLKEKIIILSNAGTPNEKIFYDTSENLKKENIKMPFCIIVPSKINHFEEEFLKPNIRSQS